MSTPGKVIVEALKVTNNSIKTLMIYYAFASLLDSKMSLHLFVSSTQQLVSNRIICRKHRTPSFQKFPPHALYSEENLPFSVLDGLVWGVYSVWCVCLLGAVFVMLENLVIYSMFLSPVISHRYGWPTWQPFDKGAMFNHRAG